MNDSENEFYLDAALAELLRYTLSNDELTSSQYYAIWNLLYYHGQSLGGGQSAIQFWVNI